MEELVDDIVGWILDCRRFENGNLAGPLPDNILSYPALQGV